MNNLKSKVVAVLTAATGLPEVYFFYPKSFAKLPCVSYYENNNQVAVWADDKPALGRLEYSVQIWGGTSAEISELAAKADAGMTAEGFARMSAADMYDAKSELYYKDMRYRALVMEV